MMIASASAGTKGSESRGTRTVEQAAGAVFVSAQDPLTLAEASLGHRVCRLATLKKH
jgi:hypothetical protein